MQYEKDYLIETKINSAHFTFIRDEVVDEYMENSLWG